MSTHNLEKFDYLVSESFIMEILFIKYNMS